MKLTKDLTVQTVPDLDRPIRYLEDAVGSGKTGLLVQHIKQAQMENHLFVAPTVALGREVAKRLEDANVGNVHHLYHDRMRESVRKRVENLIHRREPGNCHILIISGQAFRTLLENTAPALLAEYHVYLDEGLDAVEYVQLKAEKLDQFTRYLKVMPDGLTVAADGSLKTLRWVADRDKRISAEGLENLLTPNFVRIASLVSSELYDVKCNVTEKAISVVALLRPQKFTYFKSVTMVAALWSQSILAMSWQQKYGVKIEGFSHSYPLYDTHRAKGPGMEIHYCLHPTDRATLQNLSRDAVTGEVASNVPSRRQVICHVARHVAAFFKARDLDFCWNANEAFKNPEGTLNNENRMAAVSAGLNEWQRFDNVAALVCVNPPTWVKNMLLSFLNIDPRDEVTSDAVYRQWRLAHTYQTVGRCSLRNRDCSNPNVVVVLSKQCAHDIAKQFPGSRVVGCISDLPSLKNLAQATRKDNSPLYDSSDNKAWCMWRQRHPNSELTKSQWFETERRFRKLSRLETIARQG